MAKEKVILAYSGGLDTSVCIKWLQEEYDLDVVCVVGDVGQEHIDVEGIKKKAITAGAVACEVIDMKDEYVNDYLAKAIAANAMYENKYPLLSALSRPLITKYLVEYAHKYDAQYIAHGCTGKGNDQVRFETGIICLDPSIKIIAPLREWDLNTRPEEIEYALEHGIDVPVTKESPYSVDSNLWGRAIECGVLEDPWNEPPADIYALTVDASLAPDEAEYVEVEFEDGLPSGLNGAKKKFIDIIAELTEIAGKHGFGRIDMVESRLVGVKSRECYEVPGGLALILAHRALEEQCLERDLLHFKYGIEKSWAVAVYNGEWFSPLKNALDAFCASTQEDVNGTVRLKFFKGSCTIVGSKSPTSLYDYALATYDEDDAFDHAAAKGFIDLKTLSLKVWAQKRLERIGKGKTADQMLSGSSK